MQTTLVIELLAFEHVSPTCGEKFSIQHGRFRGAG